MGSRRSGNIQLADGFVRIAGIQQHAGETCVRFHVIRIDLDSFAEILLGFVFLEERIVSAA